MSSQEATQIPQPEGLVTFLATDVVGSTEIWSRSPSAAEAVARHRKIVEEAIVRHRGFTPPDQGEGDSTLSAFQRPADALAAALDAQRALSAEAWPEDAEIRVRMAVHTGDAEVLSGGNFGGLGIIRCARLRSLARAGQILISAATAATAIDGLPDESHLVEIGTVPLAGLERPEHVHQLRHPELAAPIAQLALLSARVLPNAPTTLVGREAERAQVAEKVGQSRLVTISGVGGSGKTRVALAVAEDLGDRFEDGVVWVELARLSSGGQVAGAVAALCGVSESPGSSTLDLLADQLRDSRLLIVLDNCEHILDASAELVEAVLRSSKDVRVLATSRESIGVAGESVWRIPSLAVPAEPERDPKAIGRCDSVRLFVERGAAIQPEFVLDAENARHVAQICRRLDGIPLAIELAAARLGVLSVERLLEGLDQRFRLLTGGSRTSLERHRTLLASVEWSYDLLESDEQALFRSLAVFAAPFTLDAAEAVGASDTIDRTCVFDLLAKLIDKSLVQHVGDRYRLLEFLRQFALERALEQSELDALRSRHLAAFLRRTAEWRITTQLATDATLAEVAAETPDLLAALDWSIESGAPAIRLLEPLSEFWFLMCRLDEVGPTVNRVLACFEEASPGWMETLAASADSLFLAGSVDWLGVAVAALTEDSPVRLRAKLSIGPVASGVRFIGDLERVARPIIEACRTAGLHPEEINYTIVLSLGLSQTGRHAEARRNLQWLERHVPKDAARGHFLDVVRLMMSLHCADFRASARHIDKCRSNPTHDRGLVIPIANLGLWTRDPAKVRGALEQLGDYSVADLFAASGDLARGSAALLDDDLPAAREAFRAGRDKPALGAYLYCHLHGAEIELSVGDEEEALFLVDDAVARLGGGEPPFHMAWMHLIRATLAARSGNRGLARQHAHDALDLALEGNFALIQIDALETLAVSAAKDERLETAARLVGACEAFRDRNIYRFRHHHREQDIQSMRGDLPPDALEEGTRMSLDEVAEYARRGRGERNRPTQGWESLTPAELRVVELVVEGLANKDIAKSLFVSPATIKTHLVHVYRKLSLRSRTELAAQAARRPGTIAE